MLLSAVRRQPENSFVRKISFASYWMIYSAGLSRIPPLYSSLISLHQLGSLITAHGSRLTKWQMLNLRAYICYLFVPINRPMLLHQHLFSGLTDATISHSFE